MSTLILNDAGKAYYAERAQKTADRRARRAKQADIAARGKLSAAMRAIWTPEMRAAASAAAKRRANP